MTKLPDQLQSWALGSKARIRPSLWLRGDNVPVVDVFITYCGEDPNLLLDTVRGACNLDYPRGRYRVIVLDDSSSISASIAELGNQHSNLYYSSRHVQEKVFACKAANLNHGLQYSTTLRGPRSQFVAGLDIDMIPEPQWLRRLIPHLLRDDKVGLVTPPQHWYNIPMHEPLGHLLRVRQMRTVAHVQQDSLGKAFGGGSGWVARREALDDIGGIPMVSHLEDYLTCMDLIAAEWKVILVEEPLQWGLLPDSFAGVIRQWQRWITGGLALGKTLYSSPRKRFLEAFVVESRITLTLCTTALCFFGMPVLLLSGKELVPLNGPKQSRLLLRIACADFGVQSLEGYLQSSLADYYIYILHDISRLWYCSYSIPRLLRHWYPRTTQTIFGPPSLLPGNHAANRSRENDPGFHNSTIRRLGVILWDGQAIPHLLVLCSCITGAAICSRHILSTFKNSDAETAFMELITHAGWPTAFILWTSVISNAWVPFSYALSRRKRPSREELLDRDPRTKVAYPSEKAKDQRHRRVSERHYSLVLGYILFVFVASWWL